MSGPKLERCSRIKENYAENKAGRLVPDLFLFFKKKKKAYYEVKASCPDFIFDKNELYKTLDQ